MSEAKSSKRARKIGLVLLILLLIILPVVGVYSIFSVRAPDVNAPIPEGQVEIRVEFKGISKEKFNDPTAFVRGLPENHTDHRLGDFRAHHGFWNNGFVTRRYEPNHPIPSPEVEKAMAARLETFLQENRIDGLGEKLELRYGQ